MKFYTCCRDFKQKVPVVVVGAAVVVIRAAVVVVGAAAVVVGAAVVVVGAATQQQILAYSANSRNCKAIRTQSCLKMRSL